MNEIAVERGQTVEQLLEETERKTLEQEEILKDVIYKAIDAIAYSESERKIQSLMAELE